MENPQPVSRLRVREAVLAASKLLLEVFLELLDGVLGQRHARDDHYPVRRNLRLVALQVVRDQVRAREHDRSFNSNARETNAIEPRASNLGGATKFSMLSNEPVYDFLDFSTSSRI